MKTILEDGYDIRAVQELRGHNEMKTPGIYAHVLHGWWGGIRSPVDRLPGSSATSRSGWPMLQAGLDNKAASTAALPPTPP